MRWAPRNPNECGRDANYLLAHTPQLRPEAISPWGCTYTNMPIAELNLKGNGDLGC